MIISFTGIFLGSSAFEYKGRSYLRFKFQTSDVGEIYLFFPSGYDLSLSFGDFVHCEFSPLNFGGRRGYRYVIPDPARFSISRVGSRDQRQREAAA